MKRVLFHTTKLAKRLELKFNIESKCFYNIGTATFSIVSFMCTVHINKTFTLLAKIDQRGEFPMFCSILMYICYFNLFL